MPAVSRDRSQDLAVGDPVVATLLERESERQVDQIELIASENIASGAVLEALGSEITNKTVEGYPGRRYHGGAHVVDEVETLAIERAKELFGVGFANVQPHSGSQANQAVFVALLQPGDTILSMALAAGGHLSHGAPPNMSGKWFDAVHYGVDPKTGRIDYEEMARLADRHRPRLIIAGGSAYPRTIDFEPFRRVADRVGAHFLADVAHIAGLVAGGTHPSPIGVADVVSCTTTKTLRGPRGGLVLTDDAPLATRLDSSVFPGTQGSIHLNNIAAKAVCLGEALRPGFRDYARQVVTNARVLGTTLQQRGLLLLTGGTDTHLLLVDVSPAGLSGDQAEKVIEHANLTCNKNALPGDPARPMDWSGVRLGVAAATTRGMGPDEMELVGDLLADMWFAAGPDGTPDPATTDRVRSTVSELTARFRAPR
jgi:glycine hydroxymethyltransferase